VLNVSVLLKSFLFRMFSYIYDIFVIMEKLTLQEEEAMLAIWQIGKGFIKDFMDVLPSRNRHILRWHLQ
jgi:BlaI family penicillinase repressor